MIILKVGLQCSCYDYLAGSFLILLLDRLISYRNIQSPPQ